MCALHAWYFFCVMMAASCGGAWPLPDTLLEVLHAGGMTAWATVLADYVNGSPTVAPALAASAARGMLAVLSNPRAMAVADGGAQSSATTAAAEGALPALVQVATRAHTGATLEARRAWYVIAWVGCCLCACLCVGWFAFLFAFLFCFG